ncbi:MAG: hypothetical protein P4L67_05265 [Candidatus Pacebacteria bacterium]|nr:hypothetical protein [Candidatus Paceibacterota bacterium]
MTMSRQQQQRSAEDCDNDSQSNHDCSVSSSEESDLDAQGCDEILEKPIPIYNRTEEEILNFIEDLHPPAAETKSGKKRRHRRKKKSQKAQVQENIKQIPLLKGFEVNPCTPDSSADRMTSACTPHSRKEHDGSNIIIRDEGAAGEMPKQVL